MNVNFLTVTSRIHSFCSEEESSGLCFTTVYVQENKKAIAVRLLLEFQKVSMGNTIVVPNTLHRWQPMNQEDK